MEGREGEGGQAHVSLTILVFPYITVFQFKCAHLSHSRERSIESLNHRVKLFNS